MPQKEATSQFNKSLYNNQATFMLYYHHFRNLALTMFEWEGLPPSINPRFIERALAEKGQVAILNDESLGFMATYATPSGMIDLYGEPIAYQCYGANGIYNKDFRASDIVLIRNNISHIPTIQMVFWYAARITDIEMTISVNLATQKKPWVLLIPEKERYTWEQVMMKVEGNESLIVGSKGLDLDAVKHFNLNAPYNADKLQETKETLVNEFYTRLGLNNANTDKRERLIVDEVNANNEIIELNAQVMLAHRQAAADELNQRYKWNVSVRMRTEGAKNGQVFNDHQNPA